MKAWLEDSVRLFGALFYWNARKTAFVLRGRRGQCPCQNPCDSGVAGQTGCDAAAEWDDPSRFQRAVCPLLQRQPDHTWMCSVSAAEVRPFWGRCVAIVSAAVVVLVAVAGLAAFGILKKSGFDVSVADVFWPPRWSEFSELRARRLTDQALAYAQAGQEREALTAIRAAHELTPGHYERSMLVARLHEIESPELVDNVYRQTMAAHPARRNETALAWYRSLLARGGFAEIAPLAQAQLLADREQQALWLHALLSSIRVTRQAPPLQAVIADPAIDEPVRRLAAFELQVRSGTPEVARNLLRTAPLDVEGAYARQQRIELLIEFGLLPEALELIAGSQSVLAGREFARLALTARAVAGDRDALQRDVQALLAPDRAVGFAEISLLNEHLVRFPDREFLELVAQALPRLQGKVTPQELTEAWVGFLCAAGSAGSVQNFDLARERLTQLNTLPPSLLLRLSSFFSVGTGVARIELMLPVLEPYRIELTQALRARYRVQ